MPAVNPGNFQPGAFAGDVAPWAALDGVNHAADPSRPKRPHTSRGCRRAWEGRSFGFLAAVLMLELGCTGKTSLDFRRDDLAGTDSSVVLVPARVARRLRDGSFLAFLRAWPRITAVQQGIPRPRRSHQSAAARTHPNTTGGPEKRLLPGRARRCTLRELRL